MTDKLLELIASELYLMTCAIADTLRQTILINSHNGLDVSESVESFKILAKQISKMNEVIGRQLNDLNKNEE